MLRLKPDFAPAYVELAKLAVAKSQLNQALTFSRKAEQIEPFRSGYHVLTGQILWRTGRPSDAAAQAAYVAQRWGGSDRDEAIELWDKIPSTDRPSDLSIPTNSPNKWQTAQGTIKSVSCKGRAFAITLDSKGQPQTFKSEGSPVGFSDTLWVGADHFTPCFHVEGLRVMLRYNPSKDPAYTGDLIYAGFRDDLGPESKDVTAKATGDTH